MFNTQGHDECASASTHGDDQGEHAIRAHQDQHKSSRVCRYFKKALRKRSSSLTKSDYLARLKEGELTLSRYYKEKLPHSNHKCLHEVKVHKHKMALATEDGIINIPSKSTLDVLEHYDRTNIRDYKTGSINNIRKQVKPEGKYHDQGVYYDIEFDHAKQFHPWTKGDVIFEAITLDGFTEFKLEISQEDRDRVKKQIRSTWEGIQNLQFSEGCGDENCKWCNI